MIYLENTTKNHKKWWSITLDFQGPKLTGYTTHWGRIGCVGQQSKKELAYYAAKEGTIWNMAYRKIESKIEKGYVIVEEQCQLHVPAAQQMWLRLVEGGYVSTAQIGRLGNGQARFFTEVRKTYENAPKTKESFEEVMIDLEMKKYDDLLE